MENNVDYISWMKCVCLFVCLCSAFQGSIVSRTYKDPSKHSDRNNIYYK